MPKVAFRSLPCDGDGRVREQSQFTSIHDLTEGVEVGSLIEADLLGYRRWEVVEVREETVGITRATGADGDPIPLGGTLVCRDEERSSGVIPEHWPRRAC
jgi:hypothetical protein